MRHLRNIHNYSEMAIKTCRKRAIPKANPLRKCPVKGCKAVLGRFNNHFTKIHNITSASERRQLYQEIKKERRGQGRLKEIQKVKVEVKEDHEERKTREKMVKYTIDSDTETDASEHTDDYDPERDPERDVLEDTDSRDDNRTKELLKGKTEFSFACSEFKGYLTRPEGGKKTKTPAEEDTRHVHNMTTQVLGSTPVAVHKLFPQECQQLIWREFF